MKIRLSILMISQFFLITLTLLFFYYVEFVTPSSAVIDQNPGSSNPQPTQQCVSNQGQLGCEATSNPYISRVTSVNCDGSTSIVDYCDLYDDKRCFNGSGCQIVYETKTHVIPSDPAQSDNAKVVVDGTRTCSTGVSLNPGDGLHNPDNFNDPNCKLTNSSCSQTNPDISGNDGYRCWWEYTCIAYHISDKLSDGSYAPYTATFTSTSNNSCTSTAQYTVVEPRTCVTGAQTQTIDKNGSNNQELIAPSLDDDKAIAQVDNLSTLPPEINSSTLLKLQQNQPKIGVQVGFFIFEALRKLLCSSPISGLLGISLRYCPVDEVFTNTKYFSGLTGNISSTTIPSDLQTQPSAKSCYLTDLQLKGTNTTTEGNRILDQINTDAGANNGYYIGDTPKDVQGYNSDQTNYNVSINQVVVNGDDRAPNVNCSQKKFLNLYFPSGIVPPYFTSFGCLGPNVTPIPTYAPNNPNSNPIVCNRWPINNPIGNFGDPNCDFTKGAALLSLTKNDPLHALYWFNVIIPCESGFNPDAYRSPYLVPHTPDPNGAWGLFQMGSSVNGPGTPGDGRNGPYDRGDVIWQNQIINAINYNNLINNSFAYWGCAK